MHGGYKPIRPTGFRGLNQYLSKRIITFLFASCTFLCLLVSAYIFSSLFISQPSSTSSTPSVSTPEVDAVKDTTPTQSYQLSSSAPHSYPSGLSPTALGIRGKESKHNPSNRFSYVSDETWRPDDAYVSTSNSIAASLDDFLRPKRPPIDAFPNRGEYLKQTIVNDYAHNTDKMFLMIKTGATVLWNRLPVHLATTLTRVPHYGLYADVAASVGGHEVIDVLANLTAATKQSDQFQLYRDLQEMRDRHAIADPGHSKLGGGWELDKFKNLPMLLHAWNNAPNTTEWFVFMDGDSFLMIDNLMDYLSHKNSSMPLYIGEVQFLGGTAFAHGGSGVILSRAAMEKTVGRHPQWVNQMEPHARQVCCGDYMVAYMLSKASIGILGMTDDKNDGWREGENFESHWLRNRRRREAEEDINPRDFQNKRVGHKFQKFPHWDLACTREEWCNKIIGFHHLSAMDVEILWEYEQLLGPEQRKHITYCDIYRDFTAPHIEFYMPGWNSMARQKEFSEARDLEKELNEIEKEFKQKEKEEKERVERQREKEEKEKEREREQRDEIKDQEMLKALVDEYEKIKEKANKGEENIEDMEKNIKQQIEKIQKQKERGPIRNDSIDEKEKRDLDSGSESDSLLNSGHSHDKKEVDEKKQREEEEQAYLKRLAEMKAQMDERRERLAKERADKIEELRKSVNENSKEARPWHSAEECQKKCMRDPYCNSWRYLPEEHYCANDDAVRLGRPAFTYLSYDEGEKNRKLQGAVSGYMIQRIRQTRRDKGCDTHYKLDKEENARQLEQAISLAKSIDSPDAYANLETTDTYEGWYVRRKLHEKFLSNAKETQYTKEVKEREKEKDPERLRGNDEAMTVDEIEEANALPLENLEKELNMLEAQKALQVKNLMNVRRAHEAMILEQFDRDQQEKKDEEQRLKKIEEEKRKKKEQEEADKKKEEEEKRKKEEQEEEKEKKEEEEKEKEKKKLL